MKESLKIHEGVGVNADVISITGHCTARDVRNERKMAVHEDIEEKLT